MSQLSIRNTLLTQVIATVTTGLGLQLSYENSDFDPEWLDEYCSFHFRPATSDPMGKSVASSDEEIGFIQISVYVKLNASDYDSGQLAIIDAIKKDFYFGVKLGDVNEQGVTTNNGTITQGYFKRDVTVNYSSYQGRG